MEFLSCIDKYQLCTSGTVLFMLLAFKNSSPKHSTIGKVVIVHVSSIFLPLLIRAKDSILRALMESDSPENLKGL